MAPQQSILVKIQSQRPVTTVHSNSINHYSEAEADSDHSIPLGPLLPLLLHTLPDYTSVHGMSGAGSALMDIALGDVALHIICTLFNHAPKK